MKEGREMIYVRMRHILCLIGFSGTWHNKESILCFRNIREKITEHNQELGTLTISHDSICAACIHYRAAKCYKFAEADPYYEHKDKRVAAITHLEIGKQYRLRYAIEQVLTTMSIEHLEEICVQCPYYKKQCLTYQILKKEQFKDS